MIIFKNVHHWLGHTQDYIVDHPEDTCIEGSHLTLLPALIDPHVHFRTPGAEHKENWISGAKAALCGGVTTVFDMPNNIPPCTNKRCLDEKIECIDNQLDAVNIPLRYFLYYGADADCLNDLPYLVSKIVGIKIFMGSSTGSLLVEDETLLNRLFAAAAEFDLPIGVHAEDEGLIRHFGQIHSTETNPSVHSKIRDRKAAIKATERAINLAAKHSTKLCILHMSTKEELSLVRQAKANGLSVFAEVTPHHLFLDESAYSRCGTLAQMNPPLRTRLDVEALWNGIYEGIIDTIGSDHAPHTLEEKQQSYGKAPSGIPGIETCLPLLLNAHQQGKISLSQIVKLTHTNIQRIYNLPDTEDVVLVDLHKQGLVNPRHHQSKCHWSPFSGMLLKGWPVYTIAENRIFDVSFHYPKEVGLEERLVVTSLKN